MNNKNKMKRLAIISLIVMGIMLVFAMFDAARMNRKLNELQKTVNYAQLFEEVLYPEMATAEKTSTTGPTSTVTFSFRAIRPWHTAAKRTFLRLWRLCTMP